MRVEHEAAVGAKMHALPELVDLVGADLVHVDDTCIAAGTIADEAGRHRRGQADAQVQAFANCGIALDQPYVGMNRAKCAVSHATRPLIGVELLTDPPKEADLVQARAVADLDGEGARANFGEERTTVA